MKDIQAPREIVSIVKYLRETSNGLKKAGMRFEALAHEDMLNTMTTIVIPAMASMHSVCVWTMCSGLEVFEAPR